MQRAPAVLSHLDVYHALFNLSLELERVEAGAHRHNSGVWFLKGKYMTSS